MPEFNPYQAAPGPELDTRLHQLFGNGAVDRIPAYSTDPDAADRLKSQLETRYRVCVSSGKTEVAQKRWFARSEGESTRDTEVLAETYPMAICCLALVLASEFGATSVAEPGTANEPASSAARILTAYAQKRRAEIGEAFSLQPHARRLLHDEVRRSSAPRAEPIAWDVFWSRLWPRLALGVSVLALLAIASALWLPDRRREALHASTESDAPLARLGIEGEARTETVQESLGATETQKTSANKSDREAEPLIASAPLPRDPPNAPAATAPTPPQGQSARLASAPMAASPPTPTPARVATSTAEAMAMRPVEPLLTQSAPLMPKSAAPAETANAGRMPSSPARRLTATPAATSATERLADLVAQAPAGPFGETQRIDSTATALALPAAATAPAAGIQVAQVRSSNAAAATLPDPPQQQQVIFFSQQSSRARYRRNYNSPPPPEILSSFQMQREGARIRFVDADGSVYEGIAEEGQRAAVESLRRSASGVASAGSNAFVGAGPAALRLAEPQVFSFRATGTNRSLNQKVVFDGTLVADDQAAARLIKSEMAAAGQGAWAARSSALSSPTNQKLLQNVLSGPSAPAQSPPSAGGPQFIPPTQAAVAPRFRLNGRASVGGTTELPVQAEQVRP